MQIHELDNFSGSLGSGSFIAVDNGTDTGKISTQQLVGPIEEEVSALDASLNARIDNIIAGGAAPSEAEIIDARLGANGVVYPSLGAAIRGQVTDLSDEVTERLGGALYDVIDNSLLTYGMIAGYYTTSGSYNSDSRALTSNKIPCAKGDKFVIMSTLIVSVCGIVNKFDENGDWFGYDLQGSRSVNDYIYTCNHDGYITFTSFQASADASALFSAQKIQIKSVEKDISDGVLNVLVDDIDAQEYESADFSAGFIYKINRKNEESTLTKVRIKTLDSIAAGTSTQIRIVIYSDTGEVLNVYLLDAVVDSEHYISTDCYIEVPDDSYTGIMTSSGFSVRVNLDTNELTYRVDNAKIGDTPTQYTLSNYTIKRELRYSKKVNVTDEVLKITRFLKGKKWAVVGDSITEKNYHTRYNYYDYISAKTGIAVVNYGVGGTGFGAGHNSNLAYYQRVASITANDIDLVTLFGSPNDCYDNIPIGTINDALAAGTVGGYINETVSVLRGVQPYCKIAFITPFPYYGHVIGDSDDYMEKYVAIMKDAANKYGFPIFDLYHNSCLDANDPLCIAKYYDDTGVHPNAEGHKYVAPMIQSLVSNLLFI